jgi:hypothetical protein
MMLLQWRGTGLASKKMTGSLVALHEQKVALEEEGKDGQS